MIQALEREIGERATAFSHAWREKLLEYAFRRGLMQNYRDFGVYTAQALDFTCARFDLDLDAARREALLGIYQHLPAFADAGTGLEQAGRAGFRLYAFSNGSATAVTRLLDHAGLGGYFEGDREYRWAVLVQTQSRRIQPLPQTRRSHRRPGLADIE